MRTRSGLALARPEDHETAAAEDTAAIQRSNSQSAPTVQGVSGAGPAAEQCRKDSAESSGRSTIAQGKRPAPEQTGRGEDACGNKKARTEAAQSTADKETQTDTVSPSAALEPETSHYECPICMDVLIAPVVSPCGHDFCQHCYESMVTIGASRHTTTQVAVWKCPICREIVPKKVPGVCKRLEYTIEQMFPQHLAERRAKLADELEERKRDRERAANVSGAQRGEQIAMLDVFEALHHITWEARERLGAIGAIFVPEAAAGEGNAAADAAAVFDSFLQMPPPPPEQRGQARMLGPRRSPGVGPRSSEPATANLAGPSTSAAPSAVALENSSPQSVSDAQARPQPSAAAPEGSSQEGVFSSMTPEDFVEAGRAGFPPLWGVAVPSMPLPQPTPAVQAAASPLASQASPVQAAGVHAYRQAMRDGLPMSASTAASVLRYQQALMGSSFAFALGAGAIPLPMPAGGLGERLVGPGVSLPVFTMGRVEERPRRARRRRPQNPHRRTSQSRDALPS